MEQINNILGLHLKIFEIRNTNSINDLKYTFLESYISNKTNAGKEKRNMANFLKLKGAIKWRKILTFYWGWKIK